MGEKAIDNSASFDYFFVKPPVKGNVHKAAKKLMGIKGIREVSIIDWILLKKNLMQIVMSSIPWWNDLENGTLALLAFAIFMFLPYIPYLRDVPDRLKLYRLFWNRFTVPEMRRNKIRKKR